MPVTDDITPVPADFAADSEQHHDPSGNGLSGGAGLPFVESALVADVRQSSAQGSHQTLKSILKTGKVRLCSCPGRHLDIDRTN